MLEVGACISSRTLSFACSITGCKGTRICSPAIAFAGTQGCDPVTKHTCKETLPYAPTTFPDGFQLPEREGRSCLLAEGLAGIAGRGSCRGNKREDRNWRTGFV